MFSNNFTIKKYIPNFITGLAFLFSLYGLVLLAEGLFYFSWIVLLIAFMLDFLDGYLARRWGVISTFGKVFDGFVDIFIYLIYPLLAFYLFFNLRGAFSLVVLAIFLVAGVFRLWRFNKIRFFKLKNAQLAYPGLPVVFSHLLILVFLLMKLSGFNLFPVVAHCLLLAVAVLMVLRFPFPKPEKNWPFIILLLSLIFVLLPFAYYEVR